MNLRTDDRLPVSMDQADLFLRNRVASDDIDQNLLLAFELDAGFRRPALDRALEHLLERFPLLRTRFERTSQGRVVQRPLPGFAIPIERCEVPEGEAWEAVARDFGGRPFDLESGPAIRGLLITRCHRDIAIVLSLHHVIADGESLRVLSAAFRDAYAIFCKHGRIPDTVPAGESAAAIDRSLSENDHGSESASAYWMAELEGFRQVERPEARSSDAGRGSRFAFRLTPEATETLLRTSLRNRSSVTGSLCAAFHAWIGVVTGRRDTLTSIVISARDELDVQDRVGYFLRVIPIRVEHVPDTTYAELTGSISRKVRQGVAHAVPQRLLRTHARQVGCHGDLLEMFLVHHGAAEAGEGPGSETAPRRRWIPLEDTRHMVKLSTVIVDHRLEGVVAFGPGVVTENEANELGELFVSLLTALMDAPEATVPTGIIPRPPFSAASTTGVDIDVH